MTLLAVVLTFLNLAFVIRVSARQSPGPRLSLCIIAGTILASVFMLLTMRPAVSDSGVYYHFFLILKALDVSDAVEYARFESLYTILNWLLRRLGDSSQFFFASILSLYMGGFVFAAHKVVGKSGAAFLVYSYALFPTFLYYGHNTIRQGLALVALLLGYAYLRKGSRYAYGWLLLAPLWHGSAWVAVAVAAVHELMCYRVKSERIRWGLVSAALGLSIILAAENFSQQISLALPELVPAVGDRSYYLLADGASFYRTGLRFDFFIFTALPLATALILRRRAPTLSYSGSGWWLSLYLSLSCIYFWFSFIPYADRLAAFSWFLIPLIVFLQVREVGSRHLTIAFVVVVGLINLAVLWMKEGGLAAVF